MSRVFRIADVCRELGRSPDCIREWVRRGILPATRSPSGQLQFDPRDVQAVKRGDLAPPVDGQVAPAEIQAPEAQPHQPRRPAWEEMAPWDQDVEQARASVEVERLNTDLAGVRAERERAQQGAARAKDDESAAEAERERLTKLKQHARLYSWVPSEIEAQVTAEIERFVTSAQVPAWLSSYQQSELVLDRVRQIVRAWQEERTAKINAEIDERREKARQEAEKRKQAATPLTPAVDLRTMERARRREERQRPDS